MHDFYSKSFQIMFDDEHENIQVVSDELVPLAVLHKTLFASQLLDYLKTIPYAKQSMHPALIVRDIVYFRNNWNNPNVLQNLKPGEHIRGTILAGLLRQWLEGNVKRSTFREIGDTNANSSLDEHMVTRLELLGPESSKKAALTVLKGDKED